MLLEKQKYIFAHNSLYLSDKQNFDITLFNYPFLMINFPKQKPGDPIKSGDSKSTKEEH